MNEIRQAYQKIETLVEEAKLKIKEAQKLADKHELIFSCDFGFGITGTYKGVKEEEIPKSDDKDDAWEASEGEWMESQKCYYDGYDEDPEKAKNDKNFDDIPF